VHRSVPRVRRWARLVDEGVGLRGLLGDNADGPLEDAALLPRHPRSVTLDETRLSDAHIRVHPIRFGRFTAFHRFSGFMA